MKFRYKTYLQAEKWHAELRLDVAADEPVTPNELQRLSQYGQLDVDAGGIITLAVGDPVTIATRLVQVPLDLPLRAVFSLNDYVNADVVATGWVNTVKGRIDTALDTLMALAPVPTEGTFTLPT